jgi:hypothetical protein
VELKALGGILLLCCLLAGGCSGEETKLNADEKRNFSEGMSAEKVKELGPPPTPPSGPLQGYQGGSDADKAQGR